MLVLEALDGASQKLAERMLPLGVEPVIVSNVADAVSILDERRVLITAVLFPTDGSTQNLKKDVRTLRTAGPATGLIFVSYGTPPHSSERKKLRSAGLSIGLWEPYDDATLRFQLNRALTGDRDEHMRAKTRVPTYMLARICVGERTKDAIVYSLSEGGAFLETPRASMDGAQLEVELRLPDGPIRLKSTVIYSNVPGNLQRPNIPLGMGVTFESVSDSEASQIGRFVNQRLSDLNV
jgi:hypothetical protein